jgi:hypothetical protein
MQRVIMRLREFHSQYPGKPGPPINLSHWITCALKDEQVIERDDDDLVPKIIGLVASVFYVYRIRGIRSLYNRIQLVLLL